jgi:hypothetical protein
MDVLLHALARRVATVRQGSCISEPPSTKELGFTDLIGAGVYTDLTATGAPTEP